jgi:hypothetical protein
MSNTDAHTAKCLACGRIRHFRSADAAAKAAPHGRICGAKIRKAAVDAALEGFTEAQRDSARQLIADGGLVPTKRPGVYRTASSRGDVTYLTHSAVCSCPAGLHERACYHQLAVRVVEAVAATRKAA